jgi:hypothetical protein
MKTVIEMAREAGFHVGDQFVAGASEAELERFAALVRADEREACMNALNALPYQRSTKYDCMDAIRARGETK